jgi:hypothetical protein
MRKLPLLLLSILAFPLTIPFIAVAEEAQQTEELVSTPTAALQPVSEVGRYRLFDGQLAVATLKGPDVSERHLLKIDTVTGQTWIGKQIQYVDKKGKVIQQRYWEQFEQYLEASASPATQGR